MGPGLTYSPAFVTVAGIGGLAVAYVLSRSGHRVRVLERHDFNVPSGGQRVPPNLSKILRQWVGEEELMKISTRCVGTPFHHCECLHSLATAVRTRVLPFVAFRLACLLFTCGRISRQEQLSRRRGDGARC